MRDKVYKSLPMMMMMMPLSKRLLIIVFGIQLNRREEKKKKAELKRKSALSLFQKMFSHGNTIRCKSGIESESESIRRDSYVLRVYTNTFFSYMKYLKHILFLLIYY